MLKICFTGHRPNKLGGYDWKTPKNKDIMKTLREVIGDLINSTDEKQFHFICGGALGIDQMAFNIVEDIKYNNLKLDSICFSTEIAIPFSIQACKWNYEDAKRYEIQKSQTDKLTYVDRIEEYKIKGYEEGIYYPAKMQKRNEYMVNNSDIVVAVWDGIKKGGTYNCVRYAQKQDKKIIRINPSNLEVIQ